MNKVSESHLMVGKPGIIYKDRNIAAKAFLVFPRRVAAKPFVIPPE
jgi:hypothetical protein